MKDNNRINAIMKTNRKPPVKKDPYASKTYVAKSNIEGKGLFANKKLKQDQEIGTAHIDGNPTFVLGNYHNHSENPNIYSVLENGIRKIYALRDIEPGEELTIDYRMQPELGQPEEFENDAVEDEYPSMQEGGWLDELPKAQYGKAKGNPVSDWWYNTEDVQNTYKMAPDVDPFLKDWLLHPETQRRLKENLSSSVLTRDINPNNLTKTAIKRLYSLPMFSRELVRNKGVTASDIEYNNELQGWKTPSTILGNPYYSGDPNELGVYMPDYHVSMVNSFNQPGVVTHEQTHATGPFQDAMEDVIWTKFLDKKDPKKRFIKEWGTGLTNYDLKKGVKEPTYDEVKNKYPGIYKEWQDTEKYLDRDGMYPRIMDIRRTLKLKPGQKVNKSILDNKSIANPLLDLRHYYDDDTIINMLNTLAKAQSIEKSATAKYGGWLDSYEDGGPKMDNKALAAELKRIWNLEDESFEQPSRYQDYRPKTGWGRSGMSEDELAYEQDWLNRFYYPRHNYYPREVDPGFAVNSGTRGPGPIKWPRSNASTFHNDPWQLIRSQRKRPGYFQEGGWLEDEEYKKGGSTPRDSKLYSKVLKAAKKKFKVWPNPFAKAWVESEYKRRGGDYNFDMKWKYGKGGKTPPDPDEARDMLLAGTAHGHPLTARQRQYLSEIAGTDINGNYVDDEGNITDEYGNILDSSGSEDALSQEERYAAEDDTDDEMMYSKFGGWLKKYAPGGPNDPKKPSLQDELNPNADPRFKLVRPEDQKANQVVFDVNPFTGEARQRDYANLEEVSVSPKYTAYDALTPEQKALLKAEEEKRKQYPNEVKQAEDQPWAGRIIDAAASPMAALTNLKRHGTLPSYFSDDWLQEKGFSPITMVDAGLQMFTGVGNVAGLVKGAKDLPGHLAEGNYLAAGFDALPLVGPAFKTTKNVINTHPAAWFKSAEQRLVTPELYKTLQGETSWKDPIGKIQNAILDKKLSKYSVISDKNRKLAEALENNEITNEDFVKEISKLKNKEKKLQLDLVNLNAKRSGLPLKPVITESGTPLGGGHGRIYYNTLNPGENINEVVKVGMYPGSEENLIKLVEAGKKLKPFLPNAAFPSEYVNIGKSDWGIDAAQKMPWLGGKINPKTGVFQELRYDVPSLQQEQNLIDEVELLDKFNVGIDYKGAGNIQFNPNTNRFNIYDLNYTDPKSWMSAFNRTDIPVKQRLRDKRYISSEAFEKKEGGPIVSTQGFKQGPPPRGSYYRIPSNVLYNPTDYTIEAIADTGERKILKPHTGNTTFEGANYVDEYPSMKKGGWLNKYQ